MGLMLWWNGGKAKRGEDEREEEGEGGKWEREGERGRDEQRDACGMDEKARGLDARENIRKRKKKRTRTEALRGNKGERERFSFGNERASCRRVSPRISIKLTRASYGDGERGGSIPTTKPNPKMSVPLSKPATSSLVASPLRSRQLTSNSHKDHTLPNSFQKLLLRQTRPQPRDRLGYHRRLVVNARRKEGKVEFRNGGFEDVVRPSVLRVGEEPRVFGEEEGLAFTVRGKDVGVLGCF